jgi:hypothetical protein
MNVVGNIGKANFLASLVAGRFAISHRAPRAILVFKAAQARAENAHLCDDGCLRR